MSPKSRCQLCVAIDSTKRVYTLSHTLFADCSNMRPCSTSMSTIYSKQRCATHLQLIPEAHECTHSKHGAQSRHHQQTALSPVPPPSARTRTPMPRGMLQRCRTGRAANLMVSWLRSKGVSPKHIWLVRRTRSAQAGSTNLSMPTTTPPIRL